MRHFFGVILSGFLALALHLTAAVDVSMLPPPEPWKFLAVQRIQSLLAASTATQQYPVRVLFYGQSIVLQNWWHDVASELQRLFPRAPLLIENRAIPGFNATYLIKTAEIDVYPFRPDLIIFHCYGPYQFVGQEWETLLRRFRARTTADVILLGNHVTADRELDEPTDPSLAVWPSQAWLNYVFSDALVRELGFCFPDNRSAGKAYLKALGLPARTLLSDSIHLSETGSEIQFASIRPYLHTPRFVPPLDPFNNARVATWPVGTGGLDWNEGRLRLSFTGNRVDAIAAPGTRGRFEVRLDDAPPTSFRSGRGHGRVSSWPREPFGWPGLLRVGFETLPVPERWRLQVTSPNPDNPAEFLFSVSGSTTGLDGNGNSGHRFVSNSGRVTIEPSDWFPKNAASVALVGSQLEWTSELRAVDELVADADRAQIVEAATTLVSDLPDGPHVVELIAKPDADLSAILALRTYHPGGPMPGLERSLTDEPQLRVVPLGNEWLAVWPAKSAPWEGIRRDALNLPGAALQTTTERWFGFTGAKVQLEGRMGFFGIEPR